VFTDYLAFIDVARSVIVVAWSALAILILALLAAAVERFAVASSRADDILFEALLPLDEAAARKFYPLFKRRAKNVGIAWILSVVTGPLGAYLYLGDYGRAALALVTLNGLGAWWIASWFIIPQAVLIALRADVESSIADLKFGALQR
jgi:hypothetical protein